jgi:hypothetical protein
MIDIAEFSYFKHSYEKKIQQKEGEKRERGEDRIETED